MSVTPGYILTDEYGECIGLTLPEVACVVAEADHGMDPKVGKVRVIGPITPLVMLWTPTRKPRLRVQRGEGGEGGEVSGSGWGCLVMVVGMLLVGRRRRGRRRCWCRCRRVRVRWWCWRCCCGG